MKLVQNVMLTSASLLAISSTAWGQAADASGAQTTGLEEIIVTARRKEERLQDVPTTVNVVTGDNIEKLNIRDFTDVQLLMPGLNLFGTNPVNTTASVRGITFNQVTSGANGVIEFYLNDSPLPASMLFQSMYDIGQIELLRGPQGTLRGRAAPSGSMTITTRRPTFNEWGGYVNASGADDGGQNFTGAVNIPLVEDMLAIRVAALYDENDATAVESVNSGRDPVARTKSGRATINFEPLDNLSFILTYQELENQRHTYQHVESLRPLNPSAPASPVFIAADDRLSVTDTISDALVTVDTANIQAQWSFLGQRLNYVGSKNKMVSDGADLLDAANIFGATDPAAVQGYGRHTVSTARLEAHELRLSSDERLFGMLDYSLGVFSEELESPTNYFSPTLLVNAPPGAATAGTLSLTPINRLNATEERSAFGNVTLHLGERAEISGGMRRLKYEAEAGLIQNGVAVAALEQHDNYTTTIYQGSAKYRFNDDLMAYATVGTSWRPPATLVGNFDVRPSPLEVAFTKLPAEESTSYEVGIKTSFMDKRMGLNVALYHQEYENYPWRSPTAVFFRNTSTHPVTGALLPPTVTAFNLGGAVPVNIDGVEVEWYFSPINQWDLNVNASYSKSEIDNGLVPCNDYLPHDGIPDSGTVPPTLADIAAASGSENLTGCRVSYSASQAPEFSATMQSEYRLPLTASLTSYVRGLLSYYDDSENDPTNLVDNVDSYGLLNLYLGVRSSSGNWEVSVYGKNVTETERVTSRASSAAQTNYRIGASLQTSAGAIGSSTYRNITMTDPREFGLNVRYSFGSR
jgi:iron complex outermembrane receptor protein